MITGVVGLDPSLNGTGVCRYEDGTRMMWSELLATNPKKDGTVIQRALSIAFRLQSILCPADVVFMEDYAFGMRPNASSITQLAELGGVLKAAILARTKREPILITTSEMRKFLCGDGKLKREMIPVEVLKAFGSAPASHDECVARVLMEIGVEVMYPVKAGIPLYRKKVAGNVRTRNETFLQSLAEKTA